MDIAARQIPDQPAVNRSEQQPSLSGKFPASRDMVKDPLQLCGRKIRVRNQSGLLPDSVSKPILNQLLHDRSCPPALPDDRIVDRFSGIPVPYNRCLALICDTDRRNIFRTCSDPAHGLRRNTDLSRPDLHRILLDPARVRINLLKLTLNERADLSLSVKENAAV